MMEQVLIGGRWRDAAAPVASFRAHNPATGEAIGPDFPVSSALEINEAVAASVLAAEAMSAAEPEQIAAFLERYADGIEAQAETLVALAHAETALPATPRLREVELPRTSGQLRQAARAVREHSWVRPVIDTANGLRSALGPLGKPVVVFGPNNFPLAFNAIAGSDFASAIAARNPVIAKAHPLQPGTSQALARIAHAALLASGLPAAAIQMLYHIESGSSQRLVGQGSIGAVGFTGSRVGGLALKALADAAGVPFYAEMSSVNPVFLLEGALSERGPALAQEFFTSCTMGSGQFCTNPGLLLVPHGAAGDAFIAGKCPGAGAVFRRGQTTLYCRSGGAGNRRCLPYCRWQRPAAPRPLGATHIADGRWRELPHSSAAPANRSLRPGQLDRAQRQP